VHFVAVIDDEEIPGPLRFLWEFGDGSRDVSNPTSHTYRRPGEYTALLTVTNGVGQWAQRDVMIQVD
jgi:PKD repeat protein